MGYVIEEAQQHFPLVGWRFLNHISGIVRRQQSHPKTSFARWQRQDELSPVASAQLEEKSLGIVSPE
jgi:hypothetical protein